MVSGPAGRVGKRADEQAWGALVERVRGIERGRWTAAEADGAGGAWAGRLATGWSLGGGRWVELRRGCVHEWFLLEPERGEGAGEGGAREGRGGSWWPPLCVLAHLAGRAIEAGGGHAVWIGRRCWPHGRLLWRGGAGEGEGRGAGVGVGERGRLIRRSVFVDAEEGGQRLWAMETAARSGAVSAVVAEGSGLSMAATRRLQLAARAGAMERGGGAVVLLARPPGERGALSAAASRWAVTPILAPGRWPRWRVRLWRCKDADASMAPDARDGPARSRLEGEGPEAGARRVSAPQGGGLGVGESFVLEWNHARGLVAVPAELADRSEAASTATPGVARERGSGPERGGGRCSSASASTFWPGRRTA